MYCLLQKIHRGMQKRAFVVFDYCLALRALLDSTRFIGEQKPRFSVRSVNPGTKTIDTAERSGRLWAGKDCRRDQRGRGGGTAPVSARTPFPSVAHHNGWPISLDPVVARFV